MHKFVILLVILFLILGVTFYLLIDSRVLESDEVQNAVHFFDRKEKEVEEEVEEEIEEIEGTNEEAEVLEDAPELEASEETENQEESSIQGAGTDDSAVMQEVGDETQN